jgi:hypothetical protein
MLKSAVIQLIVSANVDGVTPLPANHADPVHVSGNLWSLGTVANFGSLRLEQLLRNKDVLGDAEAAVCTRLRAISPLWLAGDVAVIGGVAPFDVNLSVPQGMPQQGAPAKLLTVLSPSAGWRVRNGQIGGVTLLFEIVGGQLAEVMCCASDPTIGAAGGDSQSVAGSEPLPGIPELNDPAAPLAVNGTLAIEVFNTYNTAGGAIVALLPAAAVGARFGLKNVGGSALALTITPPAGVTIENSVGVQGATAIIASATQACVWELGDDGNWWMIWRS